MINAWFPIWIPNFLKVDLIKSSQAVINLFIFFFIHHIHIQIRWGITS